MKKITASISGQKIRISSEIIHVAGTYGLYGLDLIYDRDWDDIVRKVVIFTSKKHPAVAVEDKTGTVVIPWEVLNKPSYIHVAVLGYGADGQLRISTTAEGDTNQIMVRRSAGDVPGNALDPTVDIWMKTAQDVGDIEELDTENKSSLVEAINEVANFKGVTRKDVEDGDAATLQAAKNYADVQDTHKVDKIEGKELSTNDFTTAEKEKLASIERGAKKNVQSDYSQEDIMAEDYIKNKPNLKPVATSGQYDDLEGKPTIPVKTSELTNDSDFVDKNTTALANYTQKTGVGATLGVTLNTTDYKLTIALKNADGEVLDTKTVDFPIESVVVNAEYRDGKIVLTLQNGTTLEVDVSSLVAGLVPDTRTINGKRLNENINLTATDVGALPDNTEIPTPNNATLTIKKNGETVVTFSADASEDKDVDLSIPVAGVIAAGNTGYVTGNDVYYQIGNVETLLTTLISGGGAN